MRGQGVGHSEGRRGLTEPLGLTLLASLGAGAAGLLPLSLVAGATALLFLAATWWGALRSNEPGGAGQFGLSLGGLLDPEPLSPSRLLRESAVALAWALGVAALIFPLYWLGWIYWWKPVAAFHVALPEGAADLLLGQFLVIALPEEAFFRGYVQTRLDRRWRPRWRVLGTTVGWGWLLASGLFALAHVVTVPSPARLAVFFPGLLFGWLRARTGGIGAPLCLHALSNLFASFLAHGYGLLP